MIPGTGDAYLNLANTFLLIRPKVVRGVGTDLAANTPVAPVNNWIDSLFSQVDMYPNDMIVTPSSNTSPFRAYVDTVLGYGTEAKNAQPPVSCGTRTPPETWIPRPWKVAIQVWLNDE